MSGASIESSIEAQAETLARALMDRKIDGAGYIIQATTLDEPVPDIVIAENLMPSLQHKIKSGEDAMEVLVEAVNIVAGQAINVMQFADWRRVSQNERNRRKTEPARAGRAKKRERAARMTAVEVAVQKTLLKIMEEDDEQLDGDHICRMGRTTRSRINFEQLAVELSETPIDDQGTTLPLPADQVEEIWNKYLVLSDKERNNLFG